MAGTILKTRNLKLETQNNQVPVNKWLITIAVMAGTFMEIVDTTVVNVALPTIAGSMASSSDEATWILTSYLISNAIILPITGWLSSLFGRKRFLLLCLILFTVSFHALRRGHQPGDAHRLPHLPRPGGGACSPSPRPSCWRPSRCGSGAWPWPSGGIGVIIAPIVGPVMGGWVTDNLTLALGLLHQPAHRSSSPCSSPGCSSSTRTTSSAAVGSIDYWGLGLLVVALGALQIVLDKGEREDWFSSDFITRLAVIAVVALVALIWRELKTAHPVVDLRLFKERNYAAGVTIMFFFRLRVITAASCSCRCTSRP